jgi:hypothetical protein
MLSVVRVSGQVIDAWTGCAFPCVRYNSKAHANVELGRSNFPGDGTRQVTAMTSFIALAPRGKT